MTLASLHTTLEDIRYMKEALRLAQQAYDAGEVPVGAIVVSGNRIIARGYNQTEQLQDCTAHAEMIALTAAFHNIGAKYLPEAVLYITLEPCLMCSGAIAWSQIGRIVYGASDEKYGYASLAQAAGKPHLFHPKAIVAGGVMKDECAQLLKSFFAQKRK